MEEQNRTLFFYSGLIDYIGSFLCYNNHICSTWIIISLIYAWFNLKVCVTFIKYGRRYLCAIVYQYLWTFKDRKNGCIWMLVVTEIFWILHRKTGSQILSCVICVIGFGIHLKNKMHMSKSHYVWASCKYCRNRSACNCDDISVWSIFFDIQTCWGCYY